MKKKVKISIKNIYNCKKYVSITKFSKKEI